jgi:hypothetical protein
VLSPIADPGARNVRARPYRRGLAGTAEARHTCVTGRVAGRSNSGLPPLWMIRGRGVRCNADTVPNANSSLVRAD